MVDEVYEEFVCVVGVCKKNMVIGVVLICIIDYWVFNMFEFNRYCERIVVGEEGVEKLVNLICEFINMEILEILFIFFFVL